MTHGQGCVYVCFPLSFFFSGFGAAEVLIQCQAYLKSRWNKPSLSAPSPPLAITRPLPPSLAHSGLPLIILPTAAPSCSSVCQPPAFLTSLLYDPIPCERQCPSHSCHPPPNAWLPSDSKCPLSGSVLCSLPSENLPGLDSIPPASKPR